MKRLKRILSKLFYRALKKLQLPTAEERIFHLKNENRAQASLLNEAAREQAERDRQSRADFMERIEELAEARAMAGSGPWTVSPETLRQTDVVLNAALGYANGGTRAAFREAAGEYLGQGAYGDIELALQNVEWRREVNISCMEFSRWGIQQIILICRLHYIKNAIIRRLIDVGACYVFGRGVEVSSPDETGNEVLKEFFERNQKVLGRIALADLHRRKFYDGNLFFAFFADDVNTGLATIRTIDATEIQEIITNPEDRDEPWFYKRSWTERAVDLNSGVPTTRTREAWYPALSHKPAEQIPQIGNIPVMWDIPIHHRKCGGVGSWLFGCPIIYPALDWAKAAKQFLESCSTRYKALAQIAMTLTMKGGQQAIAGAKQALSTTVGPTSNLWDDNPTAVDASIFAAGPGTKLEAFNTGGGPDPAKVKEYKTMACIVVGVPPTFAGDLDTANLATATTLDRPTELYMLEQQESWREDLVLIGTWVLEVSKGAASGKLRESLQKRGENPRSIAIREAARMQLPSGAWKYIEAPATSTAIEVKCTFPAIREGDIPALVGAVVESMTLGNKAGQVVGIDEKAGVTKLYELIGIDDGAELAEAQYPDGEYDPDRTKEPDPAAAIDPATGLPIAAPAGKPPAKPAAKPKTVDEALSNLGHAIIARESVNGWQSL